MLQGPRVTVGTSGKERPADPGDPTPGGPRAIGLAQGTRPRRQCPPRGHRRPRRDAGVRPRLWVALCRPLRGPTTPRAVLRDRGGGGGRPARVAT